jgi:hypothetical protein
MRLTLFAGLLLTAVVAGIAWRVWDEPAAIAVTIFGLLATGIQVAALALMQPVRQVEGKAALPRFMARWGAGMGLRFLGVVALAIAAAVDRTHFPALPAALGFLSVLLPLLVLEVKLVR